MPVQFGDRRRHQYVRRFDRSARGFTAFFRTDDDFRSGLIVGRNGAGSYSITTISR
jgi:hypothetical protein